MKFFIFVPLIILGMVVEALAPQAEAQTQTNTKTEITYTLTDLTSTVLPTQGAHFVLKKKAVTITFSKNLFGDPDIPRKPVNGMDYDELSTQLIILFTNEELFDENTRVILLNKRLILVPGSNDKLVERQVGWLIKKVEELFKLKLVKAGQ